MKNLNVIKNRISKLLEYKSNDFKKKYYLLSCLVNTKIKNDKNLMNEFKCLTNSLVESQGNKPSYDSINELLKNSYLITNKNEKIVNKKLLNINEMISYKFKQNLNESLIDQELSEINIKNLRLDLKLSEALEYAINNKISFLLESEDDIEEDEASSISARKAYFDELKKQNEMLFGITSAPKSSPVASSSRVEMDVDGDGVDDDLIDTFKKDEELFKSSSSDEEFFSKVKGDKFVKGSTKPVYTKLEKIKRMAFNSFTTVNDKRKFIIIDEIKKYLYVLKVPNYSKQFAVSLYDQASLKDEASGSILSRISMLSSGLTAERAQELRQKFKEYLEKYKFNVSAMRERELGELLKQATGSKRENFIEFFDWLNTEYPQTGKSASVDTTSDEILSDDQVDVLDQYNQYFDNIRNYSKEKEVDFEDFEMMSAEDRKKLVDDSYELIKQDEDYSDDESFNVSSSESNIETIKHILDDYGFIEENPDGSIKISVDSSKFEPKKVDRQQYLKALTELEGLKSLLKTTTASNARRMLATGSKLSAEDIEEYFNKLSIDLSRKGKKGGLALNDIAAASRGNFSGASGIKRVMINVWNKLSFYSLLDDVQKSKLYELFADRFFEGLERLGLIKEVAEDEEDTVISIEGVSAEIDAAVEKMTEPKEGDSPETLKKKQLIREKHLKQNEDYTNSLISVASAYEGIKSTLLNRKLIKAFFDGTLYKEIMEFETSPTKQTSTNMDVFEKLGRVSKFIILNELLYKKSSFRIFLSEILDDFFKENYADVNIERQLGKVVKDYFTKNYPSAGIDASGNITGEVNVEACKVDEGRFLFNPIVRWIIGKTGYKFSKKGLKSAADQAESRREFFVNNLVEVVKEYNEKYAKVQLMGVDGGEFSIDDAMDLYDDITSSNGLIGEFVKNNLENASDELYEKIENFIMTIDIKSIIERVVISLAYQELHNKQDDMFITGKEETEARNTAKKELGVYQQKFGKELDKISQEF